jgi:hypothetical protein
VLSINTVAFQTENKIRDFPDAFANKATSNIFRVGLGGICTNYLESELKDAFS